MVIHNTSIQHITNWVFITAEVIIYELLSLVSDPVDLLVHCLLEVIVTT